MKKLSKQEQKVLTLLAQGFKNRDIAAQVISKKGKPLSEKTVGTYINRLRSKLKVDKDKNVYALVTKAIDLGYFEVAEPEPIAKAKPIDVEIIKGLKRGLNCAELSMHFKSNDIKPNSLSIIEKRLKIIKKYHKANTLFHLAIILN